MKPNEDLNDTKTTKVDDKKKTNDNKKDEPINDGKNFTFKYKDDDGHETEESIKIIRNDNLDVPTLLITNFS